MDENIPNDNIHIVSLGQDKIHTDYTGTKQLFNFYHDCCDLKDCTVHVDLGDVDWVDGNMCAVFGGILYRLQVENNLKFTIDLKQVAAKCNVLFRNGFINVTGSEPQYKGSQSSTTLPFKAFRPTEKDEFINYLYTELLVHSGMPAFNDEVLGKLTDDLTELLSNINLHAETESYFFVCGQHYPTSGKVIFTVCDLGVGFLPKISKKTKGAITTASDSILWAVEGNSTKTDTVGGINLRRMKDYFSNNGGAFHIVSGDCYWNSENIGTMMYPNGVITMSKQFVGTTIHLIFNRKSLS